MRAMCKLFTDEKSEKAVCSFFIRNKKDKPIIIDCCDSSIPAMVLNHIMMDKPPDDTWAHGFHCHSTSSQRSPHTKGAVAAVSFPSRSSPSGSNLSS